MKCESNNSEKKKAKAGAGQAVRLLKRLKNLMTTVAGSKARAKAIRRAWPGRE